MDSFSFIHKNICGLPLLPPCVLSFFKSSRKKSEAAVKWAISFSVQEARATSSSEHEQVIHLFCERKSKKKNVCVVWHGEMESWTISDFYEAGQQVHVMTANGHNTLNSTTKDQRKMKEWKIIIKHLVNRRLCFFFSSPYSPISFFGQIW